jgi:hypothetical protein
MSDEHVLEDELVVLIKIRSYGMPVRKVKLLIAHIAMESKITAVISFYKCYHRIVVVVGNVLLRTINK